MARRIVVFPVTGRRWAFTTVPPPDGGRSPGNSTQTVSVMELFHKLRMSPGPSDQVDLLTNFVSDKMSSQYSAWEAAPEGSIRNRLHRIGQRMLSKLGPTESFLKAIPKDAELVEIVYPGCSVNPRLVRRRVRHLAISGEVVHRRYMYGSIALLPFSTMMGILPLPNVVLAWNLFRAYSHWRALQGSRRLNYLVTDAPSDVLSDKRDASKGSPSSSLEENDMTAQVVHWIFVPSVVLDALLLPADVPRQAISDATVAEICKEYPVDPLEILKWRDHRLPIKSFG